MATNKEQTTYSFLEFKFLPEQRLLLRDNESISLSKKNHELLKALVKSAGQVIEKDELIDLVWPNQIVTDAALNKQITRFRQALSPENPALLIETIRGVGIKFTPEVSLITQEKNRENPIMKLLWLPVLLIILWIAAASYLNRNEKPLAMDFSELQTINMAVIPGINTDDWLNVGGLNYLSDRFLSYPVIQTIKPEINWFEQEDQDIFAIELSQMPGIEYVLMVENQIKGDQFLANLQLRNQNQIVAKYSLQAATVSLLLNQIETWTLQQLNISLEVIKNQQQTKPTATDFVMESYLRGLAAARSRSYDKATQLLNTAVEQDPSFYPAWFTLADVESELGHFEKALGLINTLISSGKLSDKLRLKLAPIQAKNLIYLNRLDEAQTIIDQSMQQANTEQEINVVMYNMNNQLILNDYRGIDAESDIPLSKKLLALTEKFDPSPDQIGARQHNLAVTLNEHSKEEQAIDMIQLAIDNFAISNNYEGLLSSYRVWSDVHAYLAQFGEAKLALEKAEPYLPQVEGARTLVNFWKAYGWVHYELGDLSNTQQSLDVLDQLSIKYASLQPKVIALVLEAEMAISHGQYNRARVAVNSLLEIIRPNPNDYPADASYTAALDLYLTAVMQPVADAKAKKTEYLNAYPQLAEWIEHDLMAIDAQILFKEGFIQQAIEKLTALEKVYLGTRDISWANDTNYLIINLLITKLDDPKNQLIVKSALDRLDNRDGFVYPHKKFKAQWLAHENKMIQAITMMSEVKALAGDFWTAEDQHLLETWQAANNSQ